MKHLTFTAAVNASLGSLAMVLTLGFATTSHAQLIGYTAELDTMLWETESADDPLAGLAYYGVYNVYANLTKRHRRGQLGVQRCRRVGHASDGH